MSFSLRAYLLSFLMHSGVIFLPALFSETIQKTKKPIEVDLSLMEFEKVMQVTEKRENELTTDRHESERIKGSYEGLVFQERRIEEQETELQEARQDTFGETASEPSDTSAEKSAPPSEQARTFSQGVQTSGERPDAPTFVSPKVRSEDSVATKPDPSPELLRELYLKQELAVIRQILQENISYPPLARRMGWEGRVLLAIRIGEDGSLKEVRVLESSGYELLDKNAVDTVKRVARLFPKPPVEVMVKLPVNYTLE